MPSGSTLKNLAEPAAILKNQIKINKTLLLGLYHTSHFLAGFILEPGLHWKTSANSFRLLTAPVTRNGEGE